MRQPKGFSVTELVVLLAVLVGAAAVLTPGFVSAQAEGNEAHALRHMYRLLDAQVRLYKSEARYALHLNEVRIDGLNRFGENTPAFAHGYKFALHPTESGFRLYGDPRKMGLTGRCGFFADETGIVRYEAGGAASENSPMVGR